MKTPTGKLKFAYETIAKMEAKLTGTTTELRRLHEVNAELLAALEQALPKIDCGTHSGDRAWDAVKAAITKAQGETE